MSKTAKIILITVIVLGIMLLGFYLYNKNQNTTPTTNPTSFYQKFNPFGSSTKITPTTTDTNPNNPTPNTNNTVQTTSRLHQLTDFAVAGAVFFEDTRPIATQNSVGVSTTTPSTATTTTNTKTTTVAKPAPQFEIVPSIRYVEKATGHIYEKYLDTGVIGKISNSTVPGVYEAIFDGKASSVIYRYVSPEGNSITSFLASLGGKSVFLTSDILDISLSPDKTKFFSIIKNKDGVIGVIKSFDETKSNQVFTSPFSEWLPQWVTAGSVFLTTKPSYSVDGSAFSLDVSNGTLTKILGGIPGLTTLSNRNANYVLYGTSLNTGPKLNIFDVKSHTSKDLDTFGLPEKCIWSSDNINVYCAVPNTVVGTEYPDYWYQGLVSFDDFFVKINTTTGDKSTLVNSTDGIPVDATNLFLSNKEDELFFINKKDSTLWSLDL